MKQGPDISHHQRITDWAAVHASVDFVIHKATEGSTFTDSVFAGRWAELGRRSIPRGAYCFARPGGSSWEAQAEHFVAVCRAVGWGARDVWALDLEDPGGRSAAFLVDFAERFAFYVRARLGGPGLFYTYPHFWTSAMGSPGAIPGGMVGWWARYAPAPDAPAAWGDPPPIWQCGNGEAGCGKTVPGIGPCDWNQATDAAFAWIFGQGQEDDMFTDADRALLTRLHNQVVGAVGPGTQDFAGTVEAILAGVRTLINEGRSQAGALSAAIGKTDDTIIAAITAYLAAHPATAELDEATRVQLAADVAAQVHAAGVSVDAAPLLDALAVRLGA